MRFFRKILLKIAIILLSVSYLFAQRDTNYNAEISTVLGTEQTPFWMRANQYGMVPTKGQTAVLSVGTVSDYQKTTKKINWGYGLNVGAFVGMENKAIIQEAYFKAKWKSLEFYAGKRKEIQGLVDTTLSSGSYIWSGNAVPMPMIQISIPEYTSIGGERLISIKGNFAHGWFDRNRSDAKGVFLHQKSGYVRIGKPNYKFKFYTGFNHQAQWGGIVQYDDPEGRYSKGGSFGSSLKDYIYVVSGKSAVGGDTTKFTVAGDTLNRVGNHLGTLDVAFEINLKKANIFIYRQSIFEDGSLYYLNNITDGLNGISFTLNYRKKGLFNLNKFIVEFLNTENQGGMFYSNNPLAPRTLGFDNYFNNSQFRDGWSYNKTSIGTPFIMSHFELPKNTLKETRLMFTNNRVQAYYLGLSGSFLDEYNFTGKISFSKNWGLFGSEFIKTKPQTSLYLMVNKQFPLILGGINSFIGIASDFGDLLNQNFAIQIGIKKSWNTFPFNPHPTHRHSIKPQR